MTRSLSCLVAVLLLAGGGPAPVVPAASCESVLPGVKEWVGEHQLESQGLRDEMMARIDGLLVQFRGEVSPCVSNLWLARALLGQISEQREDVLRLTAAYLAQPGVRADPVGVSRMHSVRATTFAELGQVVRAGQDYAAAVAFVPQLPAGLAAVALRDYASHAMLRKNWTAADEALGRARRILTDSLSADPLAMRRRLGRLASDEVIGLETRLRDVREPARRRALARRLVTAADTAAAILGEAQDADQTRTANDQSYRALAISQRGYGEALLGRHEAAAASQAEALALLTPAAREINPYAAVMVSLFTSETERMRGDLPAAARSARRSRAEAAAVGDAPGEANALIEAASIDEQAGRLVDAERGYREAAAYRDAEWLRARSQDWSAVQFSTLMEAYVGLTRVLAAQGRPEEAFMVLDGARARTLRNLRASTSRRERIGPEAQASVDSLQRVIRDERVAILSGRLTPGAAVQAERRISLLQERVGRDIGAPSGDLVPLSLGRLRQTLRTQRRALVSYAVGDSATLVFVVTADTLVVRTLPTTYLDIQHLMQAAGGPWRAGGPDAAVRLGPLHALHERLIRPLRDVLPARDGLVIIPDGPLADLPFEMLVETPAQTYSDARFLIRRQPISTDLAAALIIEDAERPAADFPLDLVAFGRSRFAGSGVRWRSRSGARLNNLPNVVSEIGGLEEHIGNRETALDDDATEARFAADAAGARIVHIATHAEADPTHPLYSRVYLWDDPDQDDDGVLHLFELQDLSLPADLVVLSGCSTAAGQAQAGEGTIGLQYGVRAAGARASVATLWPVDDRATAELVGTFYAGLTDGLPADRALQRAQVAYLDTHTGAGASPYFWAATVLSGNPGPIPLRAPFPRWPWALGLLAAGGLAWRVTRRRPAPHA